jgi:phosphate transport system substrate-binding protein
LLVLLVCTTASKFSSLKTSNEKVIVTGTRFTYPVIAKWISEFKKTHPNVSIQLAPLGSPAADSANLKIVSHDIAKADLKEGEHYIALAKYGLLPIANTKSPLVTQYKDKGLQEKDIEELFFTEHIGQKNNYVVYTREQKSCAPISFASNFGHAFTDLYGIKVRGDDKALLTALQKDSLGISYNNLGYVYDVNTRKLVDRIAVLPVDLNHNGRIDADESFYTSLDEVIAKYECTYTTLLATEDVNVVYAKTPSPDRDLFLHWVLNEGQQYNHVVGFLNFTGTELYKQKLALKNTN